MSREWVDEYFNLLRTGDKLDKARAQKLKTENMPRFIYKIRRIDDGMSNWEEKGWPVMGRYFADEIVCQRIFVGQPSIISWNDDYDSSVSPNVIKIKDYVQSEFGKSETMSDKEKKGWRDLAHILGNHIDSQRLENWLNAPDFRNAIDIMSEMVGFQLKAQKLKFERALNNLVDNGIKCVSEQFRNDPNILIASFSEEPPTKLMYEKYGGICFTYETEKLGGLLECLEPVAYSCDAPLSEENCYPTLEYICTKRKEHSSEKEWRIVVNGGAVRQIADVVNCGDTGVLLPVPGAMTKCTVHREYLSFSNLGRIGMSENLGKWLPLAPLFLHCLCQCAEVEYDEV